MKMKTHNRLWLVLAGAMILIAGHGVILYFFSSHLALSATVIAGVVVKHLEVLGPLYAVLRKALRRSWHKMLSLLAQDSLVPTKIFLYRFCTDAARTQLAEIPMDI